MNNTTRVWQTYSINPWQLCIGRIGRQLRRTSFIVALCAAVLAVGVWTTDVAATMIPTSGLQAHFKADAGVVTSGSNVTQWTDQAALNGFNNAVAGGVGTRPLLTTAAIGYHPSFPVIEFSSGKPLTFSLPAANVFSGLTVIAISKNNSPGNAFETILGTGGTGGSAGVRWTFGMGNGAFGYGWGGTGGVDLGNGSALATGNWYAISWATNKTSWTVRNEYPTSLAVASPTDSSFFTGTFNGVIGTEATGVNVAQYHFSGQLAELLIYDHRLTTPEYQNVFSYLQERYFVTPEPTAGALSLWGIATVAAIRLKRHRFGNTGANRDVN